MELFYIADYDEIITMKNILANRPYNPKIPNLEQLWPSIRFYKDENVSGSVGAVNATLAGMFGWVIESINVLKGNGPNDILELIYYIGENCLKLAGLNDRRKKIDEVIKNGKAYEKFEQMVTAHGGKLKSIKLEPVAKKIIKADKEGYLNFLDTKSMGMSIIELGGGRKKIDDSVDSNAGFRLIKKHGEHVKENDVIAEIFCSNTNKIESGYRMFKKSIQIINQLPNDNKLIY